MTTNIHSLRRKHINTRFFLTDNQRRNIVVRCMHVLGEEKIIMKKIEKLTDLWVWVKILILLASFFRGG